MRACLPIRSTPSATKSQPSLSIQQAGLRIQDSAWQPLPKAVPTLTMRKSSPHSKRLQLSFPSKPQTLCLQKALLNGLRWDASCPEAGIVTKKKLFIHMTLIVRPESHTTQILRKERPASQSQNTSCCCMQAPKQEVQSGLSDICTGSMTGKRGYASLHAHLVHCEILSGN